MSTTRKVLIVYENVPEETHLYLVDVTDDEWKWMQLTMWRFVNQDMPKKAEKACNKLSEWLASRQDKKLPNDCAPVELGNMYSNVVVLVTGFIS